ncbi:hypothetical protein IW261DRAFT_1596857 [Armillaria novae-zelandiae]|uniref:Uncharacterized protein n=1 Tax=Armillaria novae-zelandiae TaxID=153914 RepID=A0AA39UBF3_9AGAR|nr:hypothetical protein IW261DRAFT_1596857 [Armillaria novae-zelandiae]
MSATYRERQRVCDPDVQRGVFSEKKRIRHGSAYLIPIVSDSKYESSSVDTGLGRLAVLRKEVRRTLSLETQGDQQKKRILAVLNAWLDAAAEHRNPENWSHCRLHYAHHVDVEHSNDLAVFELVEGSVWCIEVAMVVVRGQPRILTTLWNKLNALPAFQDRSLVRLDGRQEDSDIVKYWFTVNHGAREPCCYRGSPDVTTPAGALSSAYTHAIAVVDRVNRYPDVTEVFTISAEMYRERRNPQAIYEPAYQYPIDSFFVQRLATSMAIDLPGFGNTLARRVDNPRSSYFYDSASRSLSLTEGSMDQYDQGTSQTSTPHSRSDSHIPQFSRSCRHTFPTVTVTVTVNSVSPNYQILFKSSSLPQRMHQQQSAVKIYDGELPETGSMTNGYVFRVENPATVNYPRYIGRTSKLVTVDGDWWAVVVLETLVPARFIVVIIKRRSGKGRKTGERVGDVDLLIVPSQDRQFVTGQTSEESFAVAFATLFVYASAALVGNPSTMFDHVTRSKGDLTDYHQIFDMVKGLIRASGRGN